MGAESCLCLVWNQYQFAFLFFSSTYHLTLLTSILVAKVRNLREAIDPDQSHS